MVWIDILNDLTFSVDNIPHTSEHESKILAQKVAQTVAEYNIKNANYWESWEFPPPASSPRQGVEMPLKATSNVIAEAESLSTARRK